MEPNTPHKDRWKNRRRMAWLSMFAGFAYPVLMLVTSSEQLGAVAGPFYLFISAVVGAYIGFATVDDKWTRPTNYGDRHDEHDRGW